MVVQLVGFKQSSYKKDGVSVPRFELHTARKPFRAETEVKGLVVKTFILRGKDCDVLPLPLSVGGYYDIQTEVRGEWENVISFEPTAEPK